MNDPKRLLEVERGRTRQLLEVGLSDVAPAHTRAKVLSSMNSVVASLELGSAQGLVGHTGTPATGLSTGTANGALAKLVIVARGAGALKLSAVVAGVGLGGLVYHHVQHEEVADDRQRAATASHLEAPAHVAPTAVPRAPAPVLETEASAPAEARAVPLPPPRPRATGAQRAMRRELQPPPSAPAEVERGDELGAELELLVRARARLAAQEPRVALALLAEFGRLFPDGALAPEARLLQQRAQAQLDVPEP
jgi:hypothetical protein